MQWFTSDHLFQSGSPTTIVQFRPFDFWGRPRSPQQAGPPAAGVIITDDRYIITNNHVVENAESRSDAQQPDL